MFGIFLPLGYYLRDNELSTAYHERGNDGSQKETGNGRSANRDCVKNHQDAWRHDGSQERRAGRDHRGEFGLVALVLHHWYQERSKGGGISNCQANDRPQKRLTTMLIMARPPRTFPTRALAKSHIFRNSRPFSISCPVRTKNGTARRGNPFMPSNIRWVMREREITSNWSDVANLSCILCKSFPQYRIGRGPTIWSYLKFLTSKQER